MMGGSTESDKRTRLEQLLRAEAALKRLIEGTTADIRAQAEMVLVVVKSEIAIVKRELETDSAN